MLFNNARSRPHAPLYEVVAFSFLDSNGNFKHQSAFRPKGECVAPAGLQ